jgi:hypothetical protein
MKGKNHWKTELLQCIQTFEDTVHTTFAPFCSASLPLTYEGRSPVHTDALVCETSSLSSSVAGKINRQTARGESHDQADAEWIVIRTQLGGHNNTLFGQPAPQAGPPGPPWGSGPALQAYFVCFNYY